MRDHWQELSPARGFEVYKKYPVDGSVYYLIHTLNGIVTGMFTCLAQKKHMEIHAVFDQEFRGRVAIQAAHEVFDWIFSHTSHNKITATIDEERKNVQRYALACGMKRAGNGFELRK